MFHLFRHLYNLLSERGAKGVSQKIASLRKEKIFFRLLFFLDRKLLGFARFVDLFVKTEEKIPSVGIAQSSAWLLDRYGIDYSSAKGCFAHLKKPKKGVIFLGINHNSSFEPLILFALAERDDLYMISIKTYQLFGKNWAKHILPVMPKRYANDHQRRYRKTFFNFFKLWETFCKLHLLSDLSCQEAKRMNQASFKKAVSLLANGHGVVIFPAGGGKNSSPWRNGIGELILQLKKKRKEGSDVVIVPVIFNGLSKFKVIRAVRRRCLGRPEKVKVEIRTGREISLNELKGTDRPEEIKDLLYQMIHS